MALDLKDGPIVVELPGGPLLGVANDLNFRYVGDVGLPGPDAGKGGKHLFLPPDWKGQPTTGYFVHQSMTYVMLLAIRSLPTGGDIKAALDRIQMVKVYPLDPLAGWTTPTWTNVTEKSFDAGRRTSSSGRCSIRSLTPNRPTIPTGITTANLPCLGS
jgi:hypothetical protein